MIFSKLVSPRKSGICIVSGCDRLRFKSFVNHRLFADLNQVNYVWSFMLRREGANPYLRKIEAIESAVGSDEWLFWLDDDAFFTDMTWRLKPYIAGYSTYDMVICKSPVNEGGWTFISSGQFFLKSSKRAAAFLKAVRAIDLEDVKKWWDTEKYGMFTNGDQDAMVYVLATDKRFKEGDFFVRLPFEEFNARDFHYKNSASDFRLLHLASGKKTKDELLQSFRDRFGMNEFLIPDEFMHEVDLGGYEGLKLK